MDKNQILDQLKQINYPGFNRDIVSFGMVKDVVIDQSTITIILAISSSNEEKKNQFHSMQHIFFFRFFFLRLFLIVGQ